MSAMVHEALHPGTERNRRTVAVLFALYLLATQAGAVAAGAATGNPGP